MRRWQTAPRKSATKPKLLLLDEPVAGMNSGEKVALMGVITEIARRGFTVFMIEHDMRFVMGLCERIAVLNFGRIIAEGTPEEIKNNPDVIEAYLGRDVDAQRTFPAIAVHEEAIESVVVRLLAPAGDITIGPGFDLHDVGTLVGQPHGTQRTGNNGGEFHDSNAGQWPRNMHGCNVVAPQRKPRISGRSCDADRN